MSNTISNQQSTSNSDLHLSNGATSVLICFLAMAGSQLAQRECEIDLITWLSSRDQGILGSGVVGFDLSELPWSRLEDEFRHQKIFLANVIDRIQLGLDAPLVDYDPPHLDVLASGLLELLSSFEFSMINASQPEWWLLPSPTQEKCDTHRVFLHEAGCVVCNDH